MGAVDIELVGRLARVALEANRAYPYCRAVEVLARVSPDRSEWILGYLRCLVQLGLGEAARGLMARFDEATRADPGVRALSEAVDRAPSGRVPWTSRRRRFEANLKALAGRDAGTAEAVRASWGAASERYEMHHCIDGNVQVRDGSVVWPARWVRSLDDHRGLASGALTLESEGVLPRPLLFEGVGLGWEILEGYRRTRNVFLEASGAVYIVEPQSAAVGIVFHLHDWRELLSDASVYWFVGSEATERLADEFGRDGFLPLTDRYYSLGDREAPPARPAAVVLQQAASAREAMAARLREEIGQLYAGRDAAYWAERFGACVGEDGRACGRPLRVLGITSLHTTFLQYSMRDCLKALRDLGHETRLLIEPAHHKCLDAAVSLQAQLDFEPDIVLTLSRMRYEMTAIVHEAIPAISWDQDALPWVFDAKKCPRLAWNDFLMGFSAATAEQRFGWPAHRLMFCGMAGGSDEYSSAPVSREALAPFRSDVSYVSHASATVAEETEHASRWLSEGRLREVFRGAVVELIPEWEGGGAFPGRVMPVIVGTAERLGVRLSVEEACQVSLALMRVGDRAFRHVALGWVADWADRTGRTFHLWGHGWDRHPRFGRYARGATENGEELRRVYQATAINLQLMAYGFIHQRALDGLTAGGFFMARRSVSDVQGPALRELVGLLDACGVTDSAGLAALGDDDRTARIRALLDVFGADARMLDARVINSWRCGVLLPTADEVVPCFRELSFTSAAEFEAQAERFLGDSELRERLALGMREALRERYSYKSRMGEMLAFVSRGFRAEAEVSGARGGRDWAGVGVGI